MTRGMKRRRHETVRFWISADLETLLHERPELLDKPSAVQGERQR